MIKVERKNRVHKLKYPQKQGKKLLEQVGGPIKLVKQLRITKGGDLYLADETKILRSQSSFP